MAVGRSASSYHELQRRQQHLQQLSRSSGRVERATIECELADIECMLVELRIQDAAQTSDHEHAPTRAERPSRASVASDRSKAEAPTAVAGGGTEGPPPLHLETWLNHLPWLRAGARPTSLLGVRPLERSEVMARVLRCECTVWEARSLYRDMHLLYLRQRLALLLQAAYRRKQAQREVWELRVGVRMRHAVAHWRMRNATLVFGAWWDCVLQSRRAWANALTAACRLCSPGVARAFSAWSDALRARAEALERLRACARRWCSLSTARAYLAWLEQAAGRRRALRQLHHAAAAMLCRGMRLALNKWCSYTETRLQAGAPRAAQHASAPSRASRRALLRSQVTRLLRASLGSWRDRERARAMREWSKAIRGAAVQSAPQQGVQVLRSPVAFSATPAIG